MWGDVEILAKMPCWYFDRKQIKNSPSFLAGIDTNTENRYRREGARFIIDAGTKMGLRWDTCATGVVYFHRFYMFHSFKEFYRYVTAACCLFLAGKVEETPKKCRDVIKISQNLLSSASFSKFGDDPREEVMTMERIILKTIKFDFNVEHPYSHLLKYAKNLKCEKEKIQNMAQMAWTFINDSLCTTLCLQWEPEIVCVSLMYLASRLTKFEPSDWSGRTSSKSKWWEDWLEGMSMELMEDICHQVLDLYSNKNKKGLGSADSPVSSPSKSVIADSTPPPPPDRPPPVKRTREEFKVESDSVPKPEVKEKEVKLSVVAAKPEPESSSNSATSAADEAGSATGAPIPVAQHRTPSSNYRNNNNGSYKPSSDSDSYSSYNPYVSSRMFTSSFMSQEGSQNIQSILAGNTAPPPSAAPPPNIYSEPPPSHHHDSSQYVPPPSSSVPPHTSQYPYLPPPQSQYAPPSIHPPHAYPPPSNPPPTYDPYNPPVSNPNFPPPSNYTAPPPVSISASQHSYLPQPSQYNFAPTHLLPPRPPQRPPLNYHPPSHPYPPGSSEPHQGYGGVSRNYSMPPGGNVRKDIPALTEVKISGRPEWNMNK